MNLPRPASCNTADSQNIGTAASIGGTCTASEYGDPFDTMGNPACDALQRDAEGEARMDRAGNVQNVRWRLGHVYGDAARDFRRLDVRGEDPDVVVGTNSRITEIEASGS